MSSVSAVALLLLLCSATPAFTNAAITFSTRPETVAPATVRDGRASFSVVVDTATTVFVPDVLHVGLRVPFVRDPAAAASPLVVYGADAISESRDVPRTSFTERYLPALLESGDLRLHVEASSNATLRLRLSTHCESSCLSAYNRDGDVLLVFQAGSIAPAMQDEQHVAPRTVRIGLEAEVSPVAFPREVLTGVIAAICMLLATLGKGSHVGILCLGRLSLIARILTCTQTLDFVLHPTQISVNGSKPLGCLLTNLSLVIALAVVHTTVLRRFPMFFSVHLPGDHIVFFLAALPGTTVAAWETVVRTGAPIRWALALLILLLTIAAIAGALFVTRATTSGPLVFSRRFHRWGHATDKTFIARWRVFFTPYNGGRARWYCPAEIVLTTLLALVSALPPLPGGGGCVYKAGVAIGIVMLDGVVLAVTRPYHERRDNVFGIAFRFCETAMGACAVIATALNEAPMGPAITTGNVIAVLATVAVLTHYVIGVVVLVRGGAPQFGALSTEYIHRQAAENAHRDGEDLSDIPLGQITNLSSNSSHGRSRRPSTNQCSAPKACVPAPVMDVASDDRPTLQADGAPMRSRGPSIRIPSRSPLQDNRHEEESRALCGGDLLDANMTLRQPMVESVPHRQQSRDSHGVGVSHPSNSMFVLEEDGSTNREEGEEEEDDGDGVPLPMPLSNARRQGPSAVVVAQDDDDDDDDLLFVQTKSSMAAPLMGRNRCHTSNSGVGAREGVVVPAAAVAPLPVDIAAMLEGAAQPPTRTTSRTTGSPVLPALARRRTMLDTSAPAPTIPQFEQYDVSPDAPTTAAAAGSSSTVVSGSFSGGGGPLPKSAPSKLRLPPRPPQRQRSATAYHPTPLKDLLGDL